MSDDEVVTSYVPRGTCSSSDCSLSPRYRVSRFVNRPVRFCSMPVETDSSLGLPVTSAHPAEILSVDKMTATPIEKH